MSCAAQQATFRLLDAWVGWAEEFVENLTGTTDVRGITLAQTSHGWTSTDLSAALPPANLAPGGPCEWYLATPCPPASRLLFRNACDKNWQPVWGCCPPPVDVRCVTAIAVRCGDIAMSDPGAQKLWLLRDRGRQLVSAVDIGEPGPVTSTPRGDWLVVDHERSTLRVFDPAGGELTSAFPPFSGRVDRLGFDRSCKLWMVLTDESGMRIAYADCGDDSWTDARLEDLLDAFPETGIVAASEEGFCLREANDRICCFDRYGRPADRKDVEEAPKEVFETHGQLLTLAIDSGIPRCRWHRVRIDAEIPDETDVIVSVSSHEDAEPPPQGDEPRAEWQAFAAGRPHPDDWQSNDGHNDFLIDQPPGRYLFVRLRLRGNGRSTPVVHRIRLDFPRQTSIDSLPLVYRDNPDAEAFTERFLALFDTAVEDIDRCIERYPALLDADGVAPEVLPWLGAFLDVAMDPSWSVERRREVLAAVPDLYRRRGTVRGLEDVIELLFDVRPVIEETSLARMWGALGTSRLGEVRVFGPSTTRFRIGRSPLSRAPLMSYGNPDTDPLTVQAHRFRVFVPGFEAEDVDARIRSLVDSQKPAHTVAGVDRSKRGFVLGPGSRVGVDTAFAPLPPPVLGEPGLRLDRSAILWHGPGCRRPAIRAGQTSVIGTNTVME